MSGFIARRMAGQLACPTGWFGRHVMARVLNRLNASHNALVLEELDVGPSDRVIDVGFGGGVLLERLLASVPSGLVAGVERSEEMIELAAARLRREIAAGRAELRHASVEALPYPEEHFDKACSVNTIYFWPDLDAGLAELRRVIRRGGRLVLGFVSEEELRGAGLDRCGFSVRSPDQLERALAANGYGPGRLRSGADWRGPHHTLTAERGH